MFNADQEVPVSAAAFTGRLESAGVGVSKDGRGRAPDNASVERPWRGGNHENMDIQGQETVPGLVRGRGWGSEAGEAQCGGGGCLADADCACGERRGSRRHRWAVRRGQHMVDDMGECVC